MRQGWQELLLQSLVLLGALVAAQEDTTDAVTDSATVGRKLFGDTCTASWECGFNNSVCDQAKGCQCSEDYISNHYDKCGRRAKINESCFFDEQCEFLTPSTGCRDGACACIYETQATLTPDGTIQCIAVKNVIVQERYVDPAMIGILVAMFLMFITICVVLRLFSRARWRENRSIFNTPNPRLMNVSLLRDSKLLHQERRGSRSSVRAPSRQPSMASLRAHSPNSQGSRCGSRGSSNASVTSLRSNKSPSSASQQPKSAASVPMLESVTVEIQEGKP